MVEAALAAHYNVDLGEALFSENAVGCRKMMAWIDGLPPDSALHRKVAPGFSQTDELLWGLIQLQDEANRMYMKTHFKGKPRKPITLDRPKKPTSETSQPKPQRRMASPQDLKRLFGNAIKGSKKEE